MRSLPCASVPIVSLLLAALPCAQSVHVVDDGGGPGVDFTSIQAAINAAVDGDLILVKSGNYFGMTIDGKSLFVIADTGQTVSVTDNFVRNLSPSQSVTLIDLDINGAPGIRMTSNQGPVLVVDCDIQGSGFPVILPADGAEVFSSNAVTFSHCSIVATTFGAFDTGLDASNSNVNLYDCNVVGTGGFESLPGIAGCTLVGGTLFTSGSTFQGGPGGDGVLTPPFMICTDGGDGGPGLSINGGAAVTILDSTFLGGPGGVAGGPACSPGVDGPGINQISGTITTIPVAARSMDVTTPVREMTTGTLTFQGLPGELAFVIYSTQTDPIFSPTFQGISIPSATPFLFIFAGVIPPAGVLPANFNITLGALEEVRTIYGQALYFTLPTGFVLGCPKPAVILDSSF